MQRTFTNRAFWLVLVCLALIVGCGSPAATPAAEQSSAADAPAASAQSDAPASTETSTAAVAESAAPSAAPEAAAGGTITIVQGPEPVSLDPSVDINKTSINVQLTMFDPLVFTDAENQTIPALATEWEAVEPTRWRFKLREGVQFHNGEPFNADAVIFSIDTYNASQGEGATFFKYVKQMEKVDDYTVDIITETPNPIVPATMAFLQVLPPTYYAEQGAEKFALAPVGTGPYTFGEWQQGVQIVVKANPDYWGEAPAIGEVVFKPAPEAATRVALLETGEADIIANVPPELGPQIEQSETTRLASVPSQRMIFVEFNPFQKPFDDVRVRQAFNYAIDKESLINDLLGGNATRITGVILPGWLGYQPDALTSYDYDPEKAKALLAEAGYGDGLTVDFWFPIGRYLKDKEVAEAIAAQLSEIGVNCTMNGSDIGTLVERIHTQELTGMHLFSMAPLIKDPDYLFRTHFYSEGLNRYGWTEKTDDLIARAVSTVDQDERAELYAELDQYLSNEHVPWVYLYLQNLIYGVSERVDWQPRSDEIIDLRTIKLKG